VDRSKAAFDRKSFRPVLERKTKKSTTPFILRLDSLVKSLRIYGNILPFVIPNPSTPDANGVVTASFTVPTGGNFFICLIVTED